MSLHWLGESCDSLLPEDIQHPQIVITRGSIYGVLRNYGPDTSAVEPDKFGSVISVYQTGSSLAELTTNELQLILLTMPPEFGYFPAIEIISDLVILKF
jgi:hypothetical protein